MYAPSLGLRETWGYAEPWTAPNLGLRQTWGCAKPGAAVVVGLMLGVRRAVAKMEVGIALWIRVTAAL